MEGIADKSVDALAELASTVFRARQIDRPAPDDQLLSVLGDPLDREVSAFTKIGAPEGIPRFYEKVAVVFADPSLARLKPRPGELNPILVHEGWGTRLSPSDLVVSLLTSALEQIYFLNQTHDEATFVGAAIANLSQLCGAVRGEPVRALELVGFGGVRIPLDGVMKTPWGMVRQLPYVRELKLWSVRRRTTVTMAIPIELTVIFDRSPHPAFVQPSESIHAPRVKAGRLFPLAVILATCARAAAPDLWSQVLPPFGGRRAGFLQYMGTSGPHDVELTSADVAEVENWCRLVDERHRPAIDIAVRRLVSAVAYRAEPADKLVDSVMAWENLFGTRTESSFRVTAALARLLETDRTKRRALYKELAELYGVRSRVVHGDEIADDVVAAAADKSLRHTANALKKTYLEHADWLTLSSTQRSDRQLLEEP